MDEPVGKTIGNNLEMQEVIKALNGQMEDDIEETIMTIGSIIMAQTLNERDIDLNMARISEAIKSGKAITKFRQMVAAQHGDQNYINSSDKFRRAKYVLPVYAVKDGFISEIDTNMVGSISKFLGIGRKNKLSEIDNTAGIVFEKKIGSEVRVGEVVAYTHSDYEDKALTASEYLADAYKISDNKIRRVSRILEIYGI